MRPADLQQLVAFADALAGVSGPIARAHFRQPVAVDTKPDATPVTAADRAIESALRERIARQFPAHGIWGEEHGQDRVDAEFVWVIDPIDGTKAFASGNPLFGTLIGLCHRGRPVAGVLDAPALGERWSGALGLGSMHGARRLRTRPSRRLADAVLYNTTPDALLDHASHRALRRAVRWTSYGADCLAYAFVAMGHADLVVDAGLRPYDWCALVPILGEAGGALVDWRGAPLRLDGDGRALAAATPDLAAAAAEVLAG